jgi:hypothetical protein
MRAVQTGQIFKIARDGNGVGATRKFFIIPRVCDATGKRIWLEHGYVVSADTTYRPRKWLATAYLSEKGYTILALKGEI